MEQGEKKAPLTSALKQIIKPTSYELKKSFYERKEAFGKRWAETDHQSVCTLSTSQTSW